MEKNVSILVTPEDYQLLVKAQENCPNLSLCRLVSIAIKRQYDDTGAKEVANA